MYACCVCNFMLSCSGNASYDNMLNYHEAHDFINLIVLHLGISS